MSGKIRQDGVEEKKIICWPSPGCVQMCGLTATVKDGRLVGLRGTDDYPTLRNVQSHWWFPESPAREPSLHGLWEANANVLTMAGDPDTFDPVTGGWPLHALLCRIYKQQYFSGAR